MSVSEKAMAQFNALPQNISASNRHSGFQTRHRLSRSLTGNFTSSGSMVCSPTDETSNMNNLKTRNSFDIMPRVDKPIPSLPKYNTRPVFVKNTYANISSRPSKFIKPAAQHQNMTGKSPTDLDNIAKLFLRYNHKMYNEGYLTTMVEVTPEGRHLESTHWKKVFAELSGSTLAIWDAEKSTRQEGILPSYVNITDATLEILDQGNVGKANCFAIQNTAGANRFVFQASTRQDMEKWESCFWLACFEGTKLHEMYTRKILARSLYKPFFTKQPSSGVECYLQVRFAGKSDWKRLWTVVDKKDDKKRWGRKASSPLPGQILLYEDKKSRTPLMSLTNIVRAYAIYPETPQLSEHSTLFKIEGSISTVSTDATVDIPDRISHVLFMANNSKEMAQWLLTAFDIFKLYGRPQQMSFNQVQADGIHFSAESLLMVPGKLFLDIQEVQEKGLCDKKRWDQKGVFTDELQRKLDFEEHEQPKKPLSPKRHHVKSKSLHTPHVEPLKSKTSSTVPLSSDRPSNSQPPQVSSMRQKGAAIPTKQIGDSSEEDTEDDAVGETDEDTDDGSSLRIQPKESVISQPLSSPIQLYLEPRQLTRQSSTSSSFLLDFGNLSGSRNMSSRASSATASTSSLFGDFARSTELSKYIDPSVFEEDVKEEILADRTPVESHDNVPAPAGSRESKGYPLSFPKSNIRGLFPKLSWGTSGAIDYDDDIGSLSNPSKDFKDIEDLGGREGPPIPSLGDQFASENSLLAKKPADLPMTAQEQTEYARAMRQPFLHVPVKPKDPSSGLIGRITQLEYVRQQNSGKGADKVDKVHAFSAEVEKERYFERERDRQLVEHRQQQMLQHMMMMNGGNFALMPVIQTPHGLVPVMMPFPMAPQASMSSPLGQTMPSHDPRMSSYDSRMPTHDPRVTGLDPRIPLFDPRMTGIQPTTGLSSSSSGDTNRSPFASSSSRSSSYTGSSIHSQFSNIKNGYMSGTQAAPATALGDSSGDEDDHIPIAKTPIAKRRSGWAHPRPERL
ncbi:hypothetical protein INT44_008840 [Umbelopsis vinacea]|uniref:PH domain-containing protein n=1 Tax=Umbelopsis vinacea TaxID=44442 RepID=A0A8H7Q2G8_9FUNG|nr:hypothetical protein INT44_008840 [Umbelopsis vinacea]